MEISKTKIGVVVSSLHEACQSLMWKGIFRVAKAKDVEIITFVATSQDRVDSLDLHIQIVKDFVQRSNIDGLIMFTGTIAEFLDAQRLEDFYKSFLHLPVVSVSYDIPNVPSIMPDNTTGVIDMVDHFVNYHNYKRIVFVKGPAGHTEAEERFEAYKQGLIKNGIAYDPRLVCEGTFTAKSGVSAVRYLFASAIHFDAVICVNDEAALGVISELKKRHKHIPIDVAVAGFDDITDAAFVLPSLTTVRQPLFQMGTSALETVLLQIERKYPQMLRIMPAHPVYRRSCGCFPSTIRKSTPPSEPYSLPVSEETVMERMLQKVGNILGEALDADDRKNPLVENIQKIFETFDENIKKLDERHSFLNSLDTYLFKVEGRSGNVDSLQILLLELSSYLSTFNMDMNRLANGNNLLQQAQVLLREYKLRAAQTRNMEEAAFGLKIRETSQKIITTFDPNRLKFTILEDFPEINIHLFVFALYETPFRITKEKWKFPEHSKLIVGFNKQTGAKGDESDKLVFPTKDLIPDKLQSDEPGAYIFMPLFFKNEQFGFVVFDYIDEQPFFMYEELRLHIGSSLKSSMMMHDLKIQSMVDELTGLYNRRGFVELSKKMIDSARRAGGKLLVFYADLDGLKRINDVYGHDEGDAAISGAASVLTDTFRNKDIIARIGGDEFTVILHVGDTLEPESKILLRLREKLDDFNSFSGRPFTLSMSVGSGYFEPSGTKSLDDILKEADNRMLAKKRKRYNM
ncbi:MAG: GGDEF domain-containing protein [Deltaproteobacteria bacterium]|nr:GGDEF domain-containing protein [Deltaproteobacteria bacterium]MBN2674575.1 GGDEF domain-containing protein [Deltaproteobacteria bacterium]